MTASGAALLLRLLAVVACLAAYTHFSCAAPLALRDGALVGFEAAMDAGPRTRRSDKMYGKNVWKADKCTPKKRFCNRKFMQEKCCLTCECKPPAGGNTDAAGRRARRDEWWLPLPSQKPTPTTPTPFPYQGCYSTWGQHIGGHSGRNTLLETCADIASTGSKPFFGMEWPQGSTTPGSASCAHAMTKLPTNRVADSECGAPYNGRRLGGSWRVAVYAAAAMPLWNEHATAVNTIPSTGRSGITLVGSLQACQKECGPKTACVGFTYLSGTCSFYEKVGPLVQTPTWYNSYSPSSFGGAAEFCKKMNRARLATYSEYCAAGSVFGGKKSDGDQWAPYSGDGDNQWVQVGTSGHAECKKHTPQHGKPAWGTSTDKHHFENYVLCAGPQSKGTIAPDGAAWWRKNQAGVCSVPLGEVPGDEETYSSLTQWEIERELIPEYREERDNKGLVEHLKLYPSARTHSSSAACAMFPDATLLGCWPLCWQLPKGSDALCAWTYSDFGARKQ